jgi:hypothetical protein
MPSLRGASSRHPDRERRRARRARLRLIRVEAVSASLLFSLSAAAQTVGGLETQAPSAVQAASATSDQRPRVILLVRTENDEGVMNRVRAELRTSAWQILELRVDDRLARLPLGKLAEEQAVRAAVRFDASDGHIELWVFRPAGNVEEAVTGSGERDDAVTALRITEELRARGLTLGPESAAPEKAATLEQPARPTTIEKRERARSQARPNVAPRTITSAQADHASADTEARRGARGLWLQLGPALSGGPGALGPSFAGWSGVRLEVTPRWSGSLLGLVPILPQKLDGPEGSADVSTYLLGASIDLAWLRLPRWQAGFGVGAAWAQSEMSGAARSGYVSEHASVSALMSLARLTAQLQLAERWRLGLGALGGIALPEVSVKFGDRLAGRWGRPALLATLDLQWLAIRISPSP